MMFIDHHFIKLNICRGVNGSLSIPYVLLTSSN